MTYLVILALFLLAVWWLSCHPDFTAPSERRRDEVALRQRDLEPGDPGPIFTDLVSRSTYDTWIHR